MQINMSARFALGQSSATSACSELEMAAALEQGWRCLSIPGDLEGLGWVVCLQAGLSWAQGLGSLFTA